MSKTLLTIGITAAVVVSCCLTALFLAVIATPAQPISAAAAEIEPTNTALPTSTATPLPTPTYSDDYVCIVKTVADGFEHLPVYGVFYGVSDGECGALVARMNSVDTESDLTASVEQSAPISPVICTVNLPNGVEVDVISDSIELGAAACEGLQSSNKPSL